ncbi:helix-turn-helix transcriptional regulator [Polluticaenibacter yanchengensis]|uniref:WYL domain-containing protein n=1 Tax=Polluticaenibacter yanchengensis TaxID=3014562 RepID=A0ABT4UEC7_9BACT|nr:WYL domain-containing protein [Chitinophagaceae bacterium LY-5]
MSVNKLALLRYKTIDKCLQNKLRKWTLNKLIEKVSEALYEYEGISTGVSKRTIQADIQLMRSDKLGYNAPIIVKEKKYYAYEEEGYSINHTKVTDADIEKMSEIVSVLKQMNGFDYFDDMNDIIARLENSIYKSNHSDANYIQMEGNKLLKGIEHVLPLYQAIRKKVTLLITYQSFKAKEPKPNIYSPYLLKEYRNRWFLIAKAKKGTALITLALDRIVEFSELNTKDFVEYTGINFERYFEDTLGVTKTEKDRAHKVVIWVHHKNVPYVVTKPIHNSQQLLRSDETGSLFRLDVVLNFELERELLGFGECLKVLAPKRLQQSIKWRLEQSFKHYSDSSSDNY